MFYFTSKKETRHLPEEMTARTIATLKNGEVVWLPPWLLQVDKCKRFFMESNLTFCERPGGTVTMAVYRRGNELCVDWDTVKGEKYRPGSEMTDTCIYVTLVC